MLKSTRRKWGCHDEIQATHGTPLAGATLLHMCADYDEIEIARWLLDRGMNVDEPATVDAEGFGGHTALFATVVSQPTSGSIIVARIPKRRSPVYCWTTEPIPKPVLRYANNSILVMESMECVSITT